jgi:hypothetical protein
MAFKLRTIAMMNADQKLDDEIPPPARASVERSSG